MKVIYKMRREGKTTAAVKLARQTNSTLVVANHSVKKWVEKNFALSLSRVMTIQQLVYGGERFRDEPVVIDEVAWCLEHLTAARIVGITVDKPLTNKRKKELGLL